MTYCDLRLQVSLFSLFVFQFYFHSFKDKRNLIVTQGTLSWLELFCYFTLKKAAMFSRKAFGMETKWALGQGRVKGRRNGQMGPCSTGHSQDPGVSSGAN